MVLRVLHLVGSAVDDFHCELSRLYAQDCLANTANPDLYEFQIAYVSPNLQWRFPTSLDLEAIASSPAFSLPTAMEILTQLKIDAMVPQMFCIPGMTRYRSLFDLLNIPYVGNLADVMALTAHKAKTKAIIASNGVNVPWGTVLRAGDAIPFNYPLVFKPINTDNSLGIALARTAADGVVALQTALRHSDEVLVEDFIELGREVRCGVIEQSGHLVCLPLEEYAVHPETKPIRSFADKLKRNREGGLECAAKEQTRSWIVDPCDPVTERVWAAAKRCHVALGCRHYSLFDFRIDPLGEPWFLEAGLYCSFAQQSVISTMARSAGISLDVLFQNMVRRAISPQLDECNPSRGCSSLATPS
jgi:D-alanine-D-alanine ligase